MDGMPLSPKARWVTSQRCEPFRQVFLDAQEGNAKSWNEVEESFVGAMSAFDASIAASVGENMTDEEKTQLSADLQNGKGDFFNDLLALLLQNCAGIDILSTRRKVPGLMVETHNLDGVYPDEGPIKFMIEAKMMGTPRHINSPKQKPAGRPGSADIDKRVKELGFKCIDLKGEYSRLRTIEGASPAAGGPGGGDLTTWLHALDPKIYFFLAVRVVNDKDFERTVKWAQTAAQVLDAVGLFCFEPVDKAFTTYRQRSDVPTNLQLERVLYRACTDLASLVPPS